MRSITLLLPLCFLATCGALDTSAAVANQEACSSKRLRFIADLKPKEVLLLGTRSALSYFEENATSDPDFTLLLVAKTRVEPISPKSARKLKAKLMRDGWRPEHPNNLRGNCMFVGVGQADFKHNGLAQCQSVSNENVQATLAEITCPPLKGELLAVPLEADCDPRLEHMPGGDPTRWISVLIRRRSSHYRECRITS